MIFTKVIFWEFFFSDSGLLKSFTPAMDNIIGIILGFLANRNFKNERMTLGLSITFAIPKNRFSFVI